MISHCRYKKNSLFLTGTRILLAFITRAAWQHCMTSRKSAIEEKMFWNWKVTLSSALIFAAKNVCTINFTTGFFYVYLYLKPLKTVGCVVKNAQFPFLWTNVTKLSFEEFNLVFFTAERTLLNQLQGSVAFEQISRISLVCFCN